MSMFFISTLFDTIIMYYKKSKAYFETELKLQSKTTMENLMKIFLASDFTIDIEVNYLIPSLFSYRLFYGFLL